MESVLINTPRRRATIRRVIVLILTISCSVLVTGSARAQDLGHEGEAEHGHRNEIGFIVAGTYEAADEHNIFTLGVEYQRQLTDRINVAAALESLPSADAWVAVFPLTFRIAGAAYHFPLGGRLSLVPNVSLDLVSEEHGWTQAVVYAVNFAIGF